MWIFFRENRRDIEAILGVQLRKKGKCTPCISRGTISRSSLESRIRFLPSSMLAIPALWSPPGIAVAGTPDTPPANVPIPVTFVGIVAVCVFSYRFVPHFLIFFFRFHFHTFVRFFPIPRLFVCLFFFVFFDIFIHRYQVFIAACTVSRASPCVDHIRFRFGIPETFPNRDIFRVLAYLYIFCCIVAAVVAMVAYTFFRIFRHMRAMASVNRAYYLRWFLLFALVQFFFRVSVGNISQALIGR